MEKVVAQYTTEGKYDKFNYFLTKTKSKTLKQIQTVLLEMANLLVF